MNNEVFDGQSADIEREQIEKVYKLLQTAHREATEGVERQILQERIEGSDGNNAN